MNVFTGIIVYLLIFWTTLFAVLPWGNRMTDVPEGGQAGSAPINPRIKQKFFITAGISVIVWIIVFLLVHFKVIDFFAIAQHMSEEDLTK